MPATSQGLAKAVKGRGTQSLYDFMVHLLTRDTAMCMRGISRTSRKMLVMERDLMSMVVRLRWNQMNEGPSVPRSQALAVEDSKVLESWGGTGQTP